LRTEPTARGRTGSAGLAFSALLAFIFIVYANPGNWFEGGEEIGFAKIAAALSLTALAGSWLLYRRRLTIGGASGWALVGLFALVGLSSLWSYWPRYTADTFLDGLKYLAIFLLVANVVDSRARLHAVVVAIALASVIPAVGAIWSAAHGEHLVDGDRAGWIGIFANPNDLAYHLVIGMAMALSAREGARRRAMRVAYLALLVPLGYALVLTQSRGGLLAAGVVLLLWLMRSIRRAPTLIGIAVALGCVLYLSPNNPWRVRNESSLSHGEDVSARGRLDAWRTGLNIAAERPLTGVGAGAFVIAWPDFAPGEQAAAHRAQRVHPIGERARHRRTGAVPDRARRRRARADARGARPVAERVRARRTVRPRGLRRVQLVGRHRVHVADPPAARARVRHSPPRRRRARHRRARRGRGAAGARRRGDARQPGVSRVRHLRHGRRRRSRPPGSDRRAARRDGSRARPPRPRRQRHLRRPLLRHGHAPAVDHRSRRRQAADRQRGRQHLGRLQRRDLQLSPPARKIHDALAQFLHHQRHGGAGARLRGAR
jgi:O-antigen ligase